MAELKVKKISNKEKIDAVCQYTGNNCSVQQAPNAYVDPCYDDCKKTSEYIEQIYRKMVSIAILEDKKILLPKEISIEITNKCNLNCKHCCIDANSRTDEMSTDEIYRSIRKIAKWNPDNVSISGGEPLVRRDELLKSVLQLHKPTNNICDIELLTSRGSLRFEYVYDILSYLESRLNIKINYMTVSRYDMLTVGTLTKFFKESGREYFEKV